MKAKHVHGIHSITSYNRTPNNHNLRGESALGQRMRQAHKALRKAQEALARLQGRPDAAQEAPAAQALVAMRQTEVTRWEEAHHTYRRHLETLSLTLHPFRLADAAPQTTAQVAS